MKFWNSDEELDALIDEVAKEVAEEEAESKPGFTVIQGNDSKRGKWQDRIDNAVAKYEKELERKKELSRKTGCMELFTPEDIDYMISENESFNGKNVDFSKVEKYNKLAESAKWLDANHMNVIKADCPPLPDGRAGYICMDIKSLSNFDDITLRRTLARMLLMCDGFTISGLDEEKIHLNFLVRDIRTK